MNSPFFNILSGTSDAPESRAVLPLFAHEAAGPDGAPWVTFVPGIGNDRTFWADQAARLIPTHRVLTFDPWGHGHSPAPPRDCRFADIVAGVIALWDHLGIARSTVIGLGFGGSLALALALDHPHRIDRVVACCCRPRQPDDRRDFWRDRIAKADELGIERITAITVDRWLSEPFRAAHPDIDAQLREAMNRTTTAGYRAYVTAFIEMDFAARLGEIAAPVQFVAAEHDHGGGPVPAMAEMAAAMPNARLTVIPNSGHICVAEAPDHLATIIANFLAPQRDDEPT